MSNKFIVITGNKNKLREFQQILGDDLENKKLDLTELQGTSNEIIIAKAKEGAKILNQTILVDDTSFEINALGGMPGPYIKWFVDKMSPQTLYKMTEAFDDKSAVAQCILGLCEPGKEPMLFVGRCQGRVVAPRGSKDFGFDPCFQPDGYDQTFGEMDAEVKNKISHRGLALKKLDEYLKSLKKEEEKEDSK